MVAPSRGFPPTALLSFSCRLSDSRTYCLCCVHRLIPTQVRNFSKTQLLCLELSTPCMVIMFAMALILMNRNPSLSADNTWTETYWPLHTPMKREVKIHQHRSFENYQYHHYNIRQLSVQTKESMTLLQYAVCSIQHTL